MDELIQVNLSDEISLRQEDVELLAPFEKVLFVDQTSVNVDYNGLLNQVLQYVNIGEILQQIKAGVEYVVQIPTEFQAGLESGQLFIMENMKTGEMWPTLMELAENGKKKIRSPLPIKQREFIQGNPLRELTTGYHNLYMQMQLQELSRQMQITQTAVKRIEQGQKTDRIGLLNSGREQVLLALSQKDESSRNLALQLGRQSISDARGQLFETFRQRVLEFKPIPRSAFIQYLKTLSNSDYLSEKDDEYHEIQDYYDLYLQSTKMLAASYAIAGDIENAERVFDFSIEQMRQIDFTRLKSVKYAHKGRASDGIYDHAVKYLITEKQICLDDAKQYDCLSIAASGEKLLEVLADGRSETVPEQEAE